MSDHFYPLTCVAVFDKAFDVISYLWPIVSSADKLGVFAMPPCPACGGSWCLEIRVVLIPSLFGIHIFPWYHKRSSFHWHSPNAIPFLSFWSWCLEIRVVLIPSLFGIHIFPWYHKRSSFHWHSPNAIPFLSFSFASKFFLMAWISVSFLL